MELITGVYTLNVHICPSNIKAAGVFLAMPCVERKDRRANIKLLTIYFVSNLRKFDETGWNEKLSIELRNYQVFVKQDNLHFSTFDIVKDEEFSNTHVTFPFDMADLKREGKGFAYKVKMNVAVYSEEVTNYTYTYYLLILIFLRDPDTGLKFISKQW